MNDKDSKNDTTFNVLNRFQNFEEKANNQPDICKKYFTFFEYAPVAFWIEDFSVVKKYIDNITRENNTDVETYIEENPDIIPVLASKVTVKEVNASAVKLYKAKSKEDLLQNLNKVFTQESNEGFANLVVDLLVGKTETEVETVNRNFEGEEIDILIKFKVVEGCEETLENVIVSVENITDRINARKALEESENRYKESQNIARIGSWFYDFKSNVLHWSEEAYKMLGLEPNKHKLTLEFYLSFVHKDDIELVGDFSINNLINNPNQTLKYRIITVNGELKYINEKRSIIINADGRIERIVGIGQDVTESILAERKLNETKNLLSNTLSSIKDGFVILDSNSKYKYVNDVAANLLGKSAKDLIGKHIWAEFPEKEGDLFYDNYQIALKTKKPISFENYFEPWNCWFENRIIPSNEGMLLFFDEITQKKESENKIKEAYNIINKSSSVAILSKNKKDFPIVFSSENINNLFGYSYKEFLKGAVKLQNLIHPDDLEYFRKKLYKLIDSKTSSGFKPKPFRITTKKGKIKWVQASVDAIRNEENKITHIQGIVEDITKRKKAEDLFFESSQRLKDQFNNTPLASIMWDKDFKVIEWNNSAQRMFGYTAEEAKGKETKDLITPPYLVTKMEKILGNLLEGKGGNRNINENVTKSGKIITCDWYNVTLKDAEGNVTGVASLVDDITDRINSKKLLEKSEKKYRDIFEKSIDPVLILKNGLFVDCNQSTLKMFGFKDKKSLIKVHPSEISPEYQPDGETSYTKAEEMMDIVLKEGSNRFRWYHKQSDGKVFPAEVTLTKIDENDDKATIHAVVKDITDKVRKEELEDVIYNISRSALVLDNFKKFGYFIKTELNKVIDTSNFYIALYNDETDTITTPIFIDEKEEEIVEFSAGKTLTGHVIKTKKPLMVNNQDHHNLIDEGIVEMVGAETKKWIGVPLIIQDKAIGAIVVQSYKDEKAYSEEDVQLLEFVADQISIIIQRKDSERRLKEALVKAQESDKLKSAFLANMSHEIRTPMNGIIGFSELFLEPDLSENKRLKYAKIVINSGKQLLSIVNDILDISKIEAGAIKLVYERVNINKLLDDLYTFYIPSARQKNLTLKYSKGLENNLSVVEIDKTKLAQVLTNLLSNSFKFTKEGEIEFGYELINDELQFFIKDTGIGIEEKLQDKIFERFTQANLYLNKHHKGTGLGLAISKKFVELFNGKIWFDSNTQGTKIYFTIPYTRTKNAEIKTVIENNKPVISTNNDEIHILVADDEEYNLIYISELFSKTNFKIIEAVNGKAAIDIVKTHPEIDMVLMDIKMPIMNGNEAMREIKKMRADLPVIALSAFAIESEKESALKKGFDFYLTKPVDKKALFTIINKYSN